MSDKPPMKVVLCWHMHQPQYLDVESGRYLLPWTYLHAIKDYVDMAEILRQVPGARAVVNFAPVLLEQIADYADQVHGYLHENIPIRDPLLAALVTPALPVDNESRTTLMKGCLRANRERIIERFKPYRLLVEMVECIEDRPAAARYLNQQFLIDLLMWFHLGWLGETVRRDDTRVHALMDKGAGYSQHDRRLLLQVIGELLASTLENYRRLTEQGRVELAMSPYGHPIVPLLLDLESAKEAMPDAHMPALSNYPGGRERARWHLEEGRRVFEEHLGITPVGCWPSEGGVSRAALELLTECGFKWAATGGSVLHNSLARAGQEAPKCIHHPYRIEGSDIRCFFRDDGLSDLIGFTYAGWHGDDAVNNLVHHLENIAGACADDPNRVVAIIMDGENAWESYPENGYHFLTALYERLSTHPDLELTTFADCVGRCEPTPLENLVAGSWVYGTFSTWIGDRDKNRAWDLLGEAKRAFDAAVARGVLEGERLRAAERQLAICEGSDWFWWFGDYNPAEAVRDFDRLYRLHLSNLYRLIGEEPPDELSQIISHGGGAPEMGGVMRRAQGGT
jgi:alpha-amylase/alpha-mannosidase (GH57 family)